MVTRAGERRERFAEEALPHLDAVYRFAFRLSRGDGDSAGDLTQDTFLRAFRAWDSYTPGTNCRSWLFTICRNVFLRAVERKREEPSSGLAGDPAASAAETAFAGPPDRGPERNFFDSFIDPEVLAAIDRLPDQFREAVILRDLEDLSYAQIAEVTGAPVGTVRSRLYRGRQLLQEALLDYATEMNYLPNRERR
ncbi:MAG: sigma-70 family RNA polymerase sigma factor [Longimicrobiaceae bacterium]